MSATPVTTLIRQIRTQLLELPTLTTPDAPMVTPTGVAGITIVSYKIVARNKDQASIASSVGTTNTSNAVLSSSNFNRVTWTAVLNATYYDVYRTVGGATQGLIATIGGLQLDDTGLVGDLSTAPTLATGGEFWTDAELLDHIVNGAKDLWAAFLDIYGDHYITVDATNVSLAANATQLTGIPVDTFRVNLIEPRDLSVTGDMRNTMFVPRKYNHPAFMAARSQAPFDPTTGGIIYYDVTGIGSPSGAPVILTAPRISQAFLLRFVYNPTLAALSISSNNPIAGESDKALIAYSVAYARAKEREDRSPDPSWIAVYATEKQAVLTRSTPRQDQEPEVVDGVFDDYWN